MRRIRAQVGCVLAVGLLVALRPAQAVAVPPDDDRNGVELIDLQTEDTAADADTGDLAALTGEGTVLPTAQVTRTDSGQLAPVHLIRVGLALSDNPSSANPGSAAAKHSKDSYRVSTRQGLGLLAFAIREAAQGVPVGLNGIVLPPRDIVPHPTSGHVPCPPGGCAAPPTSLLSDLVIPVESILGLPVTDVAGHPTLDTHGEHDDREPRAADACSALAGDGDHRRRRDGPRGRLPR